MIKLSNKLIFVPIEELDSFIESNNEWSGGALDFDEEHQGQYFYKD